MGQNEETDKEIQESIKKKETEFLDCATFGRISVGGFLLIFILLRFDLF